MSTSFRNPTHPIDPQFLERWSPRAFADTLVTEDQVLSILEAARWSPSASNLQPWRCKRTSWVLLPTEWAVWNMIRRRWSWDFPPM